MERLCKSELCTGCGACAVACPMECIRMVSDAEGFLRPEMDKNVCIGCDRCKKACPILSEYPVDNSETLAYAAINTDVKIRFGSTSGGVFTCLGQWVLERGGVVFGAAYDDNFNVVHCPVEKIEDLPRLRGAKYAQSSLGDTYRRVQMCLKEDRYVLFSGTPCQVGGLVSFLGKTYDKLILVDLICHGVPSPSVWQHYISYRSRLDAGNQKPVRINLRSKETGWPKYSIRFDYPGDRFYTALNSQDLYLRGFVQNLYLRPSCYRCRFKGCVRQSDFTLGDYWGVWGQMPEYHDEKGTSLVLLHTPKAKKLWSEIANQVRFCETDLTLALTDNPSALISSDEPETRKQFFARYQEEDFQTLIAELCPQPSVPAKVSLPKRVVRKLCRMIRGILPPK